jgi:hypothetical protein
LCVLFFFSRVSCERDIAWNFVKANWNELFKRYGEGSFLLSSILSAAASYFSSHEKAAVSRFTSSMSPSSQ